MKAHYLLLTMLLAGCSKSPRQQVEDAVSSYIKNNTNDPASYEPGGFELLPYTRSDSLQEVFHQLTKESSKNTELLLNSTTAVESEESFKKTRELKSRFDAYSRANTSADTARVGWKVTHDYRAKNQYNALVKQQGAFIVYPPAQVVPLAE